MKLPANRQRLLVGSAVGICILGLLGLIVLAINGSLSSARMEDGEEAWLAARQPAGAGDEESESLVRVNWFYAQRAYPLKTIPSAARIRALDQLEREEKRLREVYAAAPGAFPNLDAQLAWTPLGPAPIGEGQTFGAPRVAV